MPTLSWKDNRLDISDMAPYDTTVMLVSPTTPLDELVADSLAWCNSQTVLGFNLMIYCHGSSGYLQLAREGVTARNAGKLAPLKPCFDGVSIHACLIAKGAAGKAFCTTLATVLYAPVAGAVSLQLNTGVQTLYGFEDDKKFDGDYYIHNTDGTRTGPLRST